MDTFQIAVDGPVAAGKGTICRLVADRLQFLYVDTGAMYRVASYIAQQSSIDYLDEKKLVSTVLAANIEQRLPNSNEADGRLVTITLNGEDVSWKIRTEEMSVGSSKVSTLPELRKVLVKKQQEIANKQNVVMEGRDITTVVLPNAQLKIYLTASDTVRAKRRHLQLQTKGIDISYAEVHKELLERDYQDTHRSADPLKKTDDAWEIDTSDLTVEQIVDSIVNRALLLQVHRA